MFFMMYVGTFVNLVRQWRTEGNFWIGLALWTKDVVQTMPMYLSFLTSYLQALITASAEKYKFIRTVKDILLEKTDNVLRFDTTATFRGSEMMREGIPLKGLIGMIAIFGGLVALFTVDAIGWLLFIVYILGGIYALTGADVYATHVNRQGRIYGFRPSNAFRMLPLRISQNLDALWRVVDRYTSRYLGISLFKQGFKSQLSSKNPPNFLNNFRLLYIGWSLANLALIVFLNVGWLWIPIMVIANLVMLAIGLWMGGRLTGVKQVTNTTPEAFQSHATEAARSLRSTAKSTAPWTIKAWCHYPKRKPNKFGKSMVKPRGKLNVPACPSPINI